MANKYVDEILNEPWVDVSVGYFVPRGVDGTEKMKEIEKDMKTIGKNIGNWYYTKHKSLSVPESVFVGLRPKEDNMLISPMNFCRFPFPLKIRELSEKFSKKYGVLGGRSAVGYKHKNNDRNDEVEDYIWHEEMGVLKFDCHMKKLIELSYIDEKMAFAILGLKVETFLNRLAEGLSKHPNEKYQKWYDEVKEIWEDSKKIENMKYPPGIEGIFNEIAKKKFDEKKPKKFGIMKQSLSKFIEENKSELIDEAREETLQRTIDNVFEMIGKIYKKAHGKKYSSIRSVVTMTIARLISHGIEPRQEKLKGYPKGLKELKETRPMMKFEVSQWELTDLLEDLEVFSKKMTKADPEQLYKEFKEDINTKIFSYKALTGYFYISERRLKIMMEEEK